MGSRMDRDGPGSVRAACQLQVLHAPHHSGASDAENALRLQAQSEEDKS